MSGAETRKNDGEQGSTYVYCCFKKEKRIAKKRKETKCKKKRSLARFEPRWSGGVRFEGNLLTKIECESVRGRGVRISAEVDHGVNGSPTS